MKRLVMAVLITFSSILHASGDAAAGQQKSMICAACHGAKGISTVAIWPNLAGQHASYLVKQLKAFKAGKDRSNPSMAPMVANLSEQDMEDLAAYFASQPPAEGRTPKKYLKRGEQLYRGGDFAKHITACIACHGPDGRGNAQAGFPLLSGQHADYLVMQLKAFKKKMRKNDLNAIMHDISSQMSDADMKAVAHYIQGLH